ncbi:hypothetical protein BGX21_000216 [Mortierella sp. AD011]|nr:hypothetical protein BGX20_000056 [Mortierella sp. AD010]KAF9401901.1 hypothetical protein BGX21_000216 [Mortierella sp. AD011]
MTSTDTIEITIPNYGAVRGIVDHTRQIATFRNIPYAVVPERWRVAVKPEPWTGVRDATNQGPVCPHLPSGFVLGLLAPKNIPSYGTSKHKYGLDHDERDCLNLNIFVPLSSLMGEAEPIPVMTWVHGGSNKNGSNAEPLYNVSNFVQRSIELNQPVIVVTINYRVNIFGFFASKELEQDMEEHSTSNPSLSPYEKSIGNWGLVDQKFAFEWVRENITAFGGNARNVTAFGESAGAIGIHFHMLIPSHHGLFDHAILQSGTVFTLPPRLLNKEGQAFFDGLLQKLEIPLDLDGKEKLKRLRAIPAEDLCIAAGGVNQSSYTPFYDGSKVIPSTVPIQALARDPAAYDPNLKSIMIGGNKDEGTAFAILFGKLNMQTWPFLYKTLVPHPEFNPLFETAYGVPATDEDVYRTVSTFIGDMSFHHGNQVVLETFKEAKKIRGEKGLKVTAYHFDVGIEALEKAAPGIGALHAGELPILFLPPHVDDCLTDKEVALGKEMQKIWIEFANQQELLINTANGDRRAIVIEDDEAIVFGADHQIQIGKGLRLSEGVQDYHGKRSEAVEQLVKSALVNGAVN